MLFNRNTSDQVRTYKGTKQDFSDIDPMNYTRLRFVGESVWINQLNGAHTFPGVLRSNLDWKATFSRGTRYEPDTRAVMYQDGLEGEGTEFFIALFPRHPNAGDSGSRTYGDLTDDTWHVGLDWTTRPSRNNDNLTVKSGFALINRHRDATTRFLRFEPGPDFPFEEIAFLDPEQIFQPEYIGPNSLEIQERGLSTDDYTADQDLWAVYAMVDVPSHRRWTVSAGARVEQSVQSVITFEQFNPALTPVEGRIATTDVLPAATVIYSSSNRSKLRFVASQTVSRPDFRELSQFQYIDHDGGYTVTGNPDLKRALIRNFDLRYEMLHGASNLVSTSIFFKDFDSPIEMVRAPGADKEIKPVNAEGAYTYGTEFEVRQALESVWWALNQFSISANLTLLKSKVRIDNTASLVDTKPDRPLQGQSPYLLNVNLN